MSTEYTATLSLLIPDGVDAAAVRRQLHRITDAIESMLATPEARQRSNCNATCINSIDTLQTLATEALEKQASAALQALARPEGQP